MIDEKNLQKVTKLELASMDDLMRMSFFTAMRISGLNLLLYKDEKKWYIGFLTGVAGYYNMRGLPMYFYVVLDEKPKKAKFIQYSSKEKEKWSYCESTPHSTSVSYLPIIELAKKPKFF
ncbi:MAG: hypothetical protein FK733_13790 [Asgard group archaeon]|nr:hypothetical protein [Asgard group archaeon]